MLFTRYGNFALGLVFLAMSVVYFFMADALPQSPLMNIGPDFMPKVVAGITFVVAGALTILSWKTLKKTAKPALEKSESEYGRVLLTILLFAMYVALYEPVGFPIMTFVYLTLQMMIFAPKEKMNLPLFGIVSLIAAFGIFFVFRNALDVLLPPGVLRGIVG